MPLNRTNFANMRSIFDFFGENAEIADCVAEQGGLETPVSREIFAKENPREYWRNLASKSVSIVPESEFAFSSVRFPSLTLNSGVARMPLGRKVPSDELKSSKELVCGELLISPESAIRHTQVCLS